MLGGRVPHPRNQRKAWADGTLKDSQECAEDHEPGVILGAGVESEDNTPAKATAGLEAILGGNGFVGEGSIHQDAEVFSKGKFDESQ